MTFLQNTKKTQELTYKVIRFIVAFVFLFSAIAKSLDVYNSSESVIKYFELINVSLPMHTIFATTLALIGIELIIGFCILLDIYVGIISFISFFFLVVVSFFVFFKMITNPAYDCGCMGQVFILSEKQTLIKNVILIILVIMLLLKRKCSQPLNILNFIIISGVSFLFCLVCSISQPLYDFGRFKIGQNLPSDFFFDEITYSFPSLNNKTDSIVNQAGDIIFFIDKYNLMTPGDIEYIIKERGLKGVDFYHLMTYPRYDTLNKTIKTGLVDSQMLSSMISSFFGYIIVNKGLIVDKWQLNPILQKQKYHPTQVTFTSGNTFNYVHATDI